MKGKPQANAAIHNTNFILVTALKHLFDKEEEFFCGGKLSKCF